MPITLNTTPRSGAASYRRSRDARLSAPPVDALPYNVSTGGHAPAGHTLPNSVSRGWSLPTSSSASSAYTNWSRAHDQALKRAEKQQAELVESSAAEHNCLQLRFRSLAAPLMGRTIELAIVRHLRVAELTAFIAGRLLELDRPVFDASSLRRACWAHSGAALADQVGQLGELLLTAPGNIPAEANPAPGLYRGLSGRALHRPCCAYSPTPSLCLELLPHASCPLAASVHELRWLALAPQALCLTGPV